MEVFIPSYTQTKQNIHTLRTFPARDYSVSGEIVINFPRAILVKLQAASPVVTVLNDKYASLSLHGKFPEQLAESDLHNLAIALFPQNVTALYSCHPAVRILFPRRV